MDDLGAPPPGNSQDFRSAAPNQPNKPNLPKAGPNNHLRTGVIGGVRFTVRGDDIQFVELEVKPGEAIIGEIKSLLYYESGIEMKIKMTQYTGNKQNFIQKILGFGKQVIAREKLFMATFTNKSNKICKVAFAAPYSGRVIDFDLPKLGGTIFCAPNAFLCATRGTHIAEANHVELGGGFLGAGFSLQKISGDGLAFIHCGGTLIKKMLARDEVMHVVTGATVAKQASVAMKIKTVRSVANIQKITELKGPGFVWIQSLQFNRVKDTIAEDMQERFTLKEKK